MKNQSSKHYVKGAMLERWKKSGKSIKAFCKEENIVNSTFHYWYRKLYGKKKTSPESTFIKLEQGTPSATHGYFCELFTAKGTRLVFHQSVKGSFLKKLL